MTSSPHEDQPAGPDIRHIAKLARLDLSDTEVALFEDQLKDILTYIDQLNEVDVSNIEPTQHSAPVSNVMRDDHAKPWDVFDPSMENAPVAHKGQFVVPRIVE